MANFTPPQFTLDAFNCPYCGAYAAQSWHQLAYRPDARCNKEPPRKGLYFSASGGAYHSYPLDGLNITACARCQKFSLWLGERIIIPPSTDVEPAHEDMPDSVKVIYDEASEIVNASPRGAAALLRVALEKLTHEIGCDPDKSINENIGGLVAQGLSPEVINALDIVRVTGNNAAHGANTLLLDDDYDTATTLFQIINYLVEQRISHIRRLSEMHEKFPDGIKRQIEQRNARALPKE